MPRRGAGKYRWLLTLMKDGADPTDSDDNDDHGDVAEVPTVVAKKIPANIRTFTSDERRHAHAVEAGSTHIVTVRYRTDVDTTRWFTLGSRRFDINGVPVDQMNEQRELEIPCKEIYRG